jgi:DNA-directed RNA polymerase subunit K/omega
MSDLEDSDIDDNDPDKELSDTEDKDDQTTFKSVKTTNPISKKLIDKVESDTEMNDDDDDDDDNEEDDDDDDDDDVDPDEEDDMKINDEGIEVNNSLYADQTIDNTSQISPINSDVESDDEDYLKKFDIDDRDTYINRYHPECFTGNAQEIAALTKIVRNADGVIIDKNHRTIPFLSKYERTKILGQRAKQINAGHKPTVIVPQNIIDGYLIAQLEFKEKKIPIILRRPLPGGTSEYWKMQDLEIL